MTRVTRIRGEESSPSWAPDNHRVAFYAVREGIGSVWVATAEPPRAEGNEDPLPRAKPAAQPQLVSRRGGAPAWSPDGRTLLVSGLPDPQPVYNGNPLRSDSEAPPLFVIGADAKPALVNYRVRGTTYIVDRLFAAAELRLGTAPQQVVRIVRTDAVWREVTQ